MKRIVDFLKYFCFITRPSLFMLVSISFIIGFYWDELSIILKGRFTPILRNPSPNIFFAFLLLGIFSNILNSYVDSKDTDRNLHFIKDYKNIFIYSNHYISDKIILAISVGLISLSLILIYLYNFILLPFFIIGVIISILYSYFPRCKGIFPLDVLLNTLGLFVIPFIIGWIHNYTILNIPLDFLASFSAVSSAFFILTTMIDYDADRSAKLMTTAVTLGLKNSAKICLLLTFLGTFFLIKRLFTYPILTIFLLSIIYHFINLYRSPTPCMALRTLKRIILTTTFYSILVLLIELAIQS